MDGMFEEPGPDAVTELTLDKVVQQLPKLYKQGDFSQAVAVCEQVIEQGARHFMVSYIYGLLCYRKHEAQRARDFVEQAEQLNPSLVDYHHLAGLLEQQNNADWITLQETRLDVFRRMEKVDGYILSYPKCGRTWLRMLMGHYLGSQTPGADYFNLKALTAADPNLPTLDVSHDDYPHWKPLSKLYRNKSSYRDKCVLFLVRDPRDVVVSYYFEYTRRGSKTYANDDGFDGSLSDFVFHPLGGLPTIVAFYNVWADNRHVPRSFKLVSYETLHSSGAETLKSSLEFFGIPADDEGRIEETVTFCQFDKMKKMEENNQYLTKPKDDDPESAKVRQGKVAGYRQYLSQNDVRRIDDYLDDNLDDLYSRYKG
jgi:tetratricopeptide (TPR) repeat protein